MRLVRTGRSRHRARIRAPLALLALLAGCSADSLGPVGNASVGHEIDAARHHRSSPALVRFDRVVPGRWDHMAVVCHGATASAVRKVAGLSRRLRPGPGDANFLSAILFLRHGRLVEYFNVGQDDDITNHWYFDPCPEHLSDDPEQNVYYLSRSRAMIWFDRRHDEGEVYWQAAAPAGAP